MRDPLMGFIMKVVWGVYAVFIALWFAVSMFVYVYNDDPNSFVGGGVVVVMFGALVGGTHLIVRRIDRGW